MTEEKKIGERTSIRAQYYHSADRAPKEQQEIVQSLGFTEVGQILELTRNRPTIVALEKVPHLIRIIE